ncbi:MAG: hypothetical protein RMK64_10455 [Rhodovarius sp.]|nr:hypothetical protein [Rhodovarius sp.]MCX7932591.1 hypothetical protein [Rhodovarius sp.]MDW8315381.1 hypothetical protein [Rhodovarius sp.]
MHPAADSLAEAMRAAQHAANNLMLGVQGNLELLRGGAEGDERALLRIRRAEASLAALRALIAGMAGLFAPPSRIVQPPRQAVESLLPLLAALGRGHPAPTVTGDAPEQEVARPAFDLALLQAAIPVLAGGPLQLVLTPQGVVVGRVCIPYAPPAAPRPPPPAGV